MSSSRKGSSFEREVCKRLSLWWTGDRRDDVFWRSSQSGGRATFRRQKGKRTYGSYGDIAAIDPIGEPLLKMFTIELKRGRSHGCPSELVDCCETDKPRAFERSIYQAYQAHKIARSYGWMLITKRDHHEPTIYADNACLRLLDRPHDLFMTSVRFRVMVNVGDDRQFFSFTAMPLEAFLERVSPQDIQKVVENNSKSDRKSLRDR